MKLGLMGLVVLTKIGCVLFVSRSGRKVGEDGGTLPFVIFARYHV